MLSFDTIFKYYHFLVGNYICFEGFYCSSFYNDTIEGDMDLVANSCSVDSDCKAFGYNKADSQGFKCNNFDPTYVKATEGFEERNILLCEFESGRSNIENQ